MELRSSEKTKPKFVRTDFKVQMNSSVLDHVVAIFTRFFFFFFFNYDQSSFKGTISAGAHTQFESN